MMKAGKTTRDATAVRQGLPTHCRRLIVLGSLSEFSLPSWRSAMAMLNLNSVLCNTSMNVVVNARMGIGSQLAGQALAILSQGYPVPTGLRPADPMWAALAMKRFYREATRERTGRSAVSPSAG